MRKENTGKQSVDFLIERKKAVQKKAKKYLAVQMVTIVVLLVYALMVAGVFSYYFIVQNQGKKIDEKIAVQEKRIKELQPVETKQVYLNSKLKSLIKILSDKKKHQSIVEAVFSMLSEGVMISGFDIDKNGVVSFNAECESFETMVTFLKKVKGQEEFAGMKVKGALVHRVVYHLIEKKDEQPVFRVEISILFNSDGG